MIKLVKLLVFKLNVELQYNLNQLWLPDFQSYYGSTRCKTQKYSNSAINPQIQCHLHINNIHSANFQYIYIWIADENSEGIKIIHKESTRVFHHLLYKVFSLTHIFLISFSHSPFGTTKSIINTLFINMPTSCDMACFVGFNYVVNSNYVEIYLTSCHDIFMFVLIANQKNNFLSLFKSSNFSPR